MAVRLAIELQDDLGTPGTNATTLFYADVNREILAGILAELEEKMWKMMSDAIELGDGCDDPQEANDLEEDGWYFNATDFETNEPTVFGPYRDRKLASSLLKEVAGDKRTRFAKPASGLYQGNQNDEDD